MSHPRSDRAETTALSQSRLFENKYGYFESDGRAFVVTRPDTPKPWANVLANPDFGTIVSQAGGGFTWIDHSALSVLTRWKMDLVRDDWGKWLYLRDEDSGALWSAAPRPAARKADFYECRHEIGATHFTLRAHDIESRWTITVPPHDSVELWWVRVRNRSNRKRTLSLASAFAWCLGANPDNHREFHRLFIETRHDEKNARIVANKCLWEVPTERHGHWNTDYPYTAAHSVWEPGRGHAHLDVRACGDLERFLGRLGDWSDPAWLQDPARESGGFGRHGDALASLSARIELEPGEEREVAFAIGVVRSKKLERDPAESFHHATAREETLAAVKAVWDKRLSAVEVQTPDEAFNLLNNVWLPYQALSARLWGRTGYWQQSGAFGFRDQLQDSHIFLPAAPEGCAKQIRLHARHQFADGTVYHWWHPLSEVGLETKMTDDLLWLPYVLTSYLKETGDFALLDEKEPFVDDKQEQTLWEHGRRAIEKVLERHSPRGLPLIGEGDWNDGLSATGRHMKGESFWLAHFLYGVLVDWAEVARRRGDEENASRWTERADALKSAINEHGWDGDWFLRATMDDGDLLGSAKCAQGKIFLNAQTWAIIHDTTTPERQQQCWQQVERHLLREYGPLLFTPAFDTPDARVGYLTRYAPGTRENGGVYTHAATWALWAACKMRQPDTALAIFHRLAPPKRAENPDLYAVEPYVLPGNINGPDSPVFGQGGWTWYTGSAAWLRRVCLHQIVGVDPDWDGLRIRPCLPPGWDKVTLRRPFRGDLFEIVIHNPDGLSEGEVELRLDGTECNPDDPIPASGQGRLRQVEAVIRHPAVR